MRNETFDEAKLEQMFDDGLESGRIRGSKHGPLLGIGLRGQPSRTAPSSKPTGYDSAYEDRQMFLRGRQIGGWLCVLSAAITIAFGTWLVMVLS